MSDRGNDSEGNRGRNYTGQDGKVRIGKVENEHAGKSGGDIESIRYTDEFINVLDLSIFGDRYDLRTGK
jgi:hypothetical protein